MWNPSRGRCSFLLEVRGAGGRGLRPHLGYPQPPYPNGAAGASKPSDAGYPLVGIGGYRVLTGLIGVFFLRALSMHGFWP